MGDKLAVLINRAKADSQISGIVPHLVDDGLSDDTILFMEHERKHIT